MPTEISDWNDLDNVRNDLSGDYVLVNDLDSGTNGYGGIGDEFEPIGFVSGNRQGDPFSGVLNGDGFKISDLVIEENDSAEAGVGFITQVGDGGLVENLSVDGTVNSTIDDNFYGGLAASVALDGTGTIQNCVSHVDVTALNGSNLGGLAGRNEDTVTESYATGSVEGVDAVGGLVGRNQDTVTESYATGSVEGDGQVGGLVGRNADTITESYAVGLVTGNEDVGGLCFDPFDSGTVTDSYWDTETTGQSTSDGGTGLTTAEMQGSEAENNMSGFDFTNTWNTVLESDEDSSADGYPILLSVDRSNQLDTQGILDVLDLSVQTNAATDIEKFAATLNGELVELDDEAEDVDVFFEFGENVGENQTAAQVLTTTDTFDEVVKTPSGQTIEFRAVAEAEDGDGETFVDEGDTLTFETTPATIDGKLTLNASPAVDATLLVENKTQEIRYGSTTTNDLGEYALGDISGLEIGDMLELLIDVKRDGKSNVTRSLYPTVGGE